MSKSEPQGQFYASAIRSGVQTISLMLGGESAQTRGAYNQAYANESKRMAAGAALSAAQRNINSVNQNKILSHIDLQMKQDQAEATVKVSAAAAGVEGTNVDNAVYTTKANEAYAFSRAEATADAEIEAYASKAHTASMQASSVQGQEIDYFGDAINGLANSVNGQDLKNMGTWWDDGNGDAIKDWFSPDTTTQTSSGSVGSASSYGNNVWEGE
jgi:hypothetical protein